MCCLRKDSETVSWARIASYALESVRQDVYEINTNENVDWEITEIPPVDSIKVVFSRKHPFSIYRYCSDGLEKICSDSKYSQAIKSNNLIGFCRRVVKQNKNAGHILNGILFDLYVMNGTLYIGDMVYSYEGACRILSQKELLSLINSVLPYGESKVKKVEDISKSVYFKNRADIITFINDIFSCKSLYSNKNIEKIGISNLSCTKKIISRRTF